MKTVKSIPLLRSIKENNIQWFERGNKKFFGDIAYKAYYGKTSGNRFLVRSTYAWSDMFGGKKTLHYRINTINDDFTIGNLLDAVFSDMTVVKEWLKYN